LLLMSFPSLYVFFVFLFFGKGGSEYASELPIDGDAGTGEPDWHGMTHVKLNGIRSISLREKCPYSVDRMIRRERTPRFYIFS
jgi:hypothetical protein